MVVTCSQCGKSYDDVYRLTYCPHEKFEMNTVVWSGDRIIGVAHSVEELNRMLEEANKV
jgi:hypothetical protein